MVRKIKSTKIALSDAKSCREWIVNKFPFNPEYVKNFINELEITKNKILNNPNSGLNVDDRELKHLGLQRYKFLFDNYYLFYKYYQEKDLIIIYAIIPTRLVWQEQLAKKLTAK